MDSGISGSSGQNTNINTNSTPIPAVLPLFSIPNYEIFFFQEKTALTISYIIRSCFFISRNGRLCFREVVGNTRNFSPHNENGSCCYAYPIQAEALKSFLRNLEFGVVPGSGEGLFLVKVKVAQSCPPLCDGILYARYWSG